MGPYSDSHGWCVCVCAMSTHVAYGIERVTVNSGYTLDDLWEFPKIRVS